MGFTRQASSVTILVGLTLWLQCAGMALLIHWVRGCIARGMKLISPWRTAVVVIRFTGVMIVLHILEILLWAGFYRWRCFPSWESSFYFSAASFSTAGYGDVVLPRAWRPLGPLESVIGMIMCGLSVSALFAILVRFIESEAWFSSAASTQRASIHRSLSDETDYQETLAK